MIILNSADLRNNLANVIETVSKKKKPLFIGRFGQAKAVLVDVFTYNWQKQVLDYLKRIDKLTPSEIETLNILLDDSGRKMLFSALEEIKREDVVTLEEFLKS